MGLENLHIRTEEPAILSMGDSNAPAPKTPYVLVVTRNGHMAEPVMDYALNVADRLKILNTCRTYQHPALLP